MIFMILLAEARLIWEWQTSTRPVDEPPRRREWVLVWADRLSLGPIVAFRSKLRWTCSKTISATFQSGTRPSMNNHRALMKRQPRQTTFPPKKLR